METINNGKSIFEARLDVDTCWQCLEYYAGLAASMAGKAWPGLASEDRRAEEQNLAVKGKVLSSLSSSGWLKGSLIIFLR